MTINPDFTLPGFTRYDMDGGMLFIRWTAMPPATLTVVRTSPNIYTFHAQNGKRIFRASAPSLKQLAGFCEDFFK